MKLVVSAKVNHWRKYFLGLAMQNETFVVNQSVNYAELVEFNYFELIYYIVGQSFLKTGGGISRWGNFITKSGKC